MTKRERFLLAALAAITGITIFSLYAIATFDRIGRAQTSIAKYRSAISSLPEESVDRTTLERELETLREKASNRISQSDLTQSEIASFVKKSLTAHGIEPARIQTAKSGGVETVEFLLECGSYSFFSFLHDLPSPGHHWRYALVAVKSIPSGNSISVTLRLSHE